MRIIIFNIIIALTVFACKNDIKEAGEHAFLGGEIINPNDDFVTLLKADKVLDTIKKQSYFATPRQYQVLVNWFNRKR